MTPLTISSGIIERYDAMTPTGAYMVSVNAPMTVKATKWCALYGYAFGDSKIKIGPKTHRIEAGQYFSLFVRDQGFKAETESKLFLVVRLGHKPEDRTGWLEQHGRHIGIDGISSTSLTVSSDSSKFTSAWYQVGDSSFMTASNTSVTYGCVARGAGEIRSATHREVLELSKGKIFSIEPTLAQVTGQRIGVQPLSHDLTVLYWTI